MAAGILLIYTTASLAQTGQLEGTVTEAESNEPLPGINIGIKGTTLGDATGTEGNFAISQIPAGSHTVQITAVDTGKYRAR